MPYLFEQNCSDPIAQIMTQLQRWDGDGANEDRVDEEGRADEDQNEGE